MNRIESLAARYVAAVRGDDEIEMLRLNKEVQPSEWDALMQLAEKELPELARKPDPEKLMASALKHGLDAETAGIVVSALTK